MRPSSSSLSPRLLAPLALVASAVAVVVVVAGSLAGDASDGIPPSQAAAEQTETTATETAPRRNRIPKSHVIQPGDTLGGISEQTGVPIDVIEELNPEVDPQALIAGQRIKLRE